MKSFPGLRRFFRVADPERDLEAEIAFHIETHVDDLVRRGVPRERARLQASAAFGDRPRWEYETLTVDRDFASETRMKELLGTLRQDLAYALRGLRRAPGFATVAILTLALGIGATVALFSAVSGVILRPLPWRDADRIVHVGERGISETGPGQNTSSENAFDWQRMSRSFQAMGLYTTFSMTLTGGRAPIRVEVANVTPGMFDVFRIVPALGRAIGDADTTHGTSPVAVVSHEFWQSRLGGSPAIVGSTIQLNFLPVRVIGVLPPGFQGPQDLDRPIWLNFVYDTSDGRGGRSKNVFALLRPGVSVPQANAEMSGIARQLAERYPRYNRDQIVIVSPVQELVVGEVDRPLYLLLGASALVLLIACANVSNLLLVRGIARQRELAVRAAMGAGRRRIAQQLFVESAVLTVAASIVGLLIAWWATRTIGALGPEVFNERAPALDGRVLAFAIALAGFCALLFGAAPAFRGNTGDLTALRSGTRVFSHGTRRARSALAVAQVALAVVLLSACGLVLKSFARVLRVDPGVQVANRLFADVWLPRARYDSGRSTVFYAQLEERLRATPGVRAVGFTSQVPLSGYLDRISISDIGGRPLLTGADAPEADRYIVSPGYLDAMGIRLVRGRAITADDRWETMPVALVDEVFARRAFPNEDPIGQTMKLPARAERATIVGVVGHVKTYGLDAASPGQIYMSNAQYRWRWLAVVVHTTGSAATFAPVLERAVQSVDADQPVANARTMEDALAELLRARRLTLSLLGTFAAVALVLASVGLYAVIAYGVSQRRGEFGIRMALGAPAGAVARMIVGEGGRLALGGVALGVIAALGGGRMLASQLYEVSPVDPAVLSAVALALLAVAVAACLMPARRAARVDPVLSLRAD